MSNKILSGRNNILLQVKQKKVSEIIGIKSLSYDMKLRT